jgi:hypothetical protein
MLLSTEICGLEERGSGESFREDLDADCSAEHYEIRVDVAVSSLEDGMAGIM